MATGACMPEPDSGTHRVVEKPLGFRFGPGEKRGVRLGLSKGRPTLERRLDFANAHRLGNVVIHPRLEPVLKDTLGAVLYQEQVIQVAMEITGCTAGQADLLRRNFQHLRNRVAVRINALGMGPHREPAVLELRECA